MEIIGGGKSGKNKDNGLQIKLGPKAHDKIEYLLENTYLHRIEGKIKRFGHRPEDMLTKVMAFTKGWPKSIGGALFTIVNGKRWHLQKADDLIAFLETKGMHIEWYACPSAPTQARFYQFVRMRAPHYDSLELLPHYPRVKNVWYETPPPPSDNTDGYLDRFLEFFNPLTPVDGVYIKALVLTLFWGGPGGARPFFSLQGPGGDDPKGGRGVGKSRLTDAIKKLCGGMIDFEPLMTRADMTKQILSANSGERLIRMDNLKGKLSSAVLESLVTSEDINGHLMYFGNHTIPNRYTWIMTDNQPDYSSDISDRVVLIKLERPEYDASWWPRLTKFVDDYKNHIVYDCISQLKNNKSANTTTRGGFRFADWSKEVLAKCTADPNISLHITGRQKESSEDLKLVDDIISIIDDHMEEYVFPTAGLNGLKYNRSKHRYRIRRSLVVKWIKSDPDYKYMTGRKFADILMQSKPDWLVLPPKEPGKRQQLGTVTDGYQMIDIGVTQVDNLWIIEKSPLICRSISRIVSAKRTWS